MLIAGVAMGHFFYLAISLPALGYAVMIGSFGAFAALGGVTGCALFYWAMFSMRSNLARSKTLFLCAAALIALSMARTWLQGSLGRELTAGVPAALLGYWLARLMHLELAAAVETASPASAPAP
jgi:hypothetical protein